MANRLIPTSHLTEDQIRAVELPITRHRIIAGPPGSGKTQVLLHRARHLVHQGHLRYHVLTLSSTLVSYLAHDLDFLELDAEHVGTFDKLCRQLYTQYISKRVPYKKSGKRSEPDFPRIREELHAFLVAGKLSEPLYDFILVDEGQDLPVMVYEMLGHLAKHITVTMDAKQRIYPDGADSSSISRTLGIPDQHLALLGAYRVSPHLATLAAQFLTATERDTFLRQVRTEQGERQTPVVYVAENPDDEKARIVEAVRSRVQQGEHVGILFHRRDQVWGYSNVFQEAGIDVEVAHAFKDMRKLDFSSDRPKLLTYHGAKGMTFDSVVLPRLVPSSFYNTPDIAAPLFVAVTRATRWALLTTVQGTSLPQLDALMTGSDAWTVQRIQDLVPDGTELSESSDELDLFN